GLERACRSRRGNGGFLRAARRGAAFVSFPSAIQTPLPARGRRTKGSVAAAQESSEGESRGKARSTRLPPPPFPAFNYCSHVPRPASGGFDLAASGHTAPTAAAVGQQSP